MRALLTLLAAATCSGQSQPPPELPPHRVELVEAPEKPDRSMVPYDEQRLTTSIPLLGGGRVRLGDLQQRAVVLEFSVGDGADDNALHPLFAELAAAHVGDVEIFAISIAPTADEAEAWAREAPPFQIGHDPQGGVAAKLDVAELPLVIVLDLREGTERRFAGRGPEVVDGVREAVRRVLAAEGG